VLEDEPDTFAPARDPAALPSVLGEIPAQDPDVVDNARHRLASRYAVSGRHYPRELLAGPADDVPAVSAVINAVRSGAEHPADALDVGAGLAILCNLRHYLDRLEADLLDAALRVKLDWDVIAAITGIPAVQAQSRHLALRARRDAQ
jgi:hypothetical protein